MKSVFKKNDVLLALWLFKRYVSVAKINSKRGTPKMVCIIKISDQLPKFSTLKWVIPICVYIHACLFFKNLSLFIVTSHIFI